MKIPGLAIKRAPGAKPGTGLGSERRGPGRKVKSRLLTTRHLRYGEKEISHLTAKDPALAKVIAEVGLVKREVIPDTFTALVHSIISQQISAKALITVWARMRDMFAPFTPGNIASIPAATLQTCGISMRKAVYIKEVAASVTEGDLDLAELHLMDDDAVCRRLSGIKGIGIWTAEMLLTFSMERPDILSRHDLAIQRGLRMLYRHKKITPALFAKYKKRYSPYATVASLYLWALAGGACVGYSDPAAETGPRPKTAPEAKNNSRAAGETPKATRPKPEASKRRNDAL